MLFRVAEERMVDIYKSYIKTNIKYFFYLNQRYAWLLAPTNFYLVALRILPPNACVENCQKQLYYQLSLTFPSFSTQLRYKVLYAIVTFEINQ